MSKTAISVELNNDEIKILEKRAKKELLSLRELCSDILRRSAKSSKTTTATDKVDDKFLTFFSRKSQKKKY